MATVKPTPAKSQLAAVKKAEAQRAAQQQAAQQRAAAQRAAAQQAAAQRAAQERAQRAAQLQAAAQAQQRAAAQQAALQRAQRAATMTGGQQRAQGSPGMLPAVFPQPGALQADQERAQRAATMTGGEIPGPRRPLNPFTTDSFPQQTGSGIQRQGFGGYGFDPALVDYLNSQKQLSTYDAGISYTYDPGTQTFTGYTMGGPVTKTLAQIQAEAASRPPVMSDRGGQQPIQGLGSFPGMQQPIQGLGSFPGNLPPRDIGLGGPPPGFTGPRGLPSGAPPQQVEPFRPIEGMAGNLVGGFTPPPPPNQAGQLIGLGGQPQQYLMEQQRVMDVTQGSSAYPPSFMPGQAAINAGLGFGQAMGAPAVPQQSPTQAAFMQATQYNPRNQLNMSSNMQQPAQNQSTGFGQSNMFSNMQQPAPMQSNMNAGMGQNLSNAVGQTSANLFGGGPSASATQQQRQQQQPGPARTGGVF